MVISMIKLFQKKLNFNRVKGFTLAEAVLSILVTLMCTIIMFNTLQILKSFENSKRQPNQAAFSYIQLKNFMRKNSDWTTLGSSGSNDCAVFIKHKKAIKKGKRVTLTDIYTIEQNKGVLRLTKDDQGYMPLLDNVEDAKFEYHGTVLKAIITEKNGKKTEWYFKTDKGRIDDNESNKEKTKSKRTAK